jgi:outer membrane lipoprotein SlyB
MKPVLLSASSALLTLFSTQALAQAPNAYGSSPAPLTQEVAVVGSKTPRFVTLQERQCTEEIVESQTNDGAIAGGIIGGLIGSQVGEGSGKTAAAVAGAIIGSQVGSTPGVQAQRRTVCRMVPVTMQRGWTVVFEYQGQRFTHIFPQ